MKRIFLIIILSIIITFSSVQTVDDTINSAVGQSIENSESVIVSYDHLPNDIDVSNLDELGVGIYYNCKYINAIITDQISLETIEKIKELPNVANISPRPVLKPLLDVSAPAVKARESDEYSPETAWELGFTGKGINIAILDSGVDDSHPAFPNKFVGGAEFSGFIITPRDGNTNPDDTNGHGTSVAGIALGDEVQNDIFMGIAPDARLVDVKVTNGISSNLVRALEWCIDNKDRDWNNNGLDEYDGIDIVSISLGSDEDADGTSPICQLLNQVVDAGIVVVTASGNNGPDNQGLGEVAAADKVITVGNLDIYETVDRSDDEVHPSSSTGPRRSDGDDDPYDELKPDLVAPGTGITSPRFSIIGQRGNGYDTDVGSSYACPHVSGICALMLEANPDLRPKEIKEILHKTAEAKGEPDMPELSNKYNFAYGYGSADAYEAVHLAQNFISTNQKPVIKSVTASPKYVKPNEQSIITTNASDSDGDQLSYEYQATGGEITGSGAQVTWTAPDAIGEYAITTIVNDGRLSSDPVSITITVETEPGNHAPKIEKIEVDPTVVEPGESATITVTAVDPDGDEIFYEYDATGGTISGSGRKVVWIAPSSAGSYTISITVNDGALYSESEKIIITVEGGGDNKAPTIESFTASNRYIETGETIQLRVKASDPENGELQYSYSATGGTISGTGPEVTWLAPDAPDHYYIEVVVSDIFGLYDEDEIMIEVSQPRSPPEILEKKATPATITSDGLVDVLFTVKVDDLNGLDDISKVTLDLTSVLGDRHQKMYDNGKHGDAIEDDGIYSYSYLIPQNIPAGSKSVSIYVEDYTDNVVTDSISIVITAAPEDTQDEGLIEQYLPLPGFDGVILALAFMIMILILITGRKRSNRKNRH